MSRADLDAQRALFEAWMRKECGATDESLQWGRAIDMWTAWQAALDAQAPAQGEPTGQGWITAQVARHLDLQYRNGVSAGWNAGIDGDGEKLAQLKSRVGTKAEYAALFPAAPVQGEPVAGDAEDAARYRYLRANSIRRVGFALHLSGEFEGRTLDGYCDAAIDAARKAGEP